PLLADGGPHADRHGAAQAGRPQRRAFARLLSAHGGLWVRRRHPAEIAWALAGLRDEVGGPGLRGDRRAGTRLGRFLRGAGLDRPGDAALPARLVASPDGGGGTNGPHELPAAVGDLHDDLLRPRPWSLRPNRPGWSTRYRSGRLGLP